MKLLKLATIVFAVLGLATTSWAEDAGEVQKVVNPMDELTANGEKHEFQAEVNRLMDIIINSLYSNREIFLRELISNAADASDKIRYLSLQDSSVLGDGDLADLDIRIQADAEAKTITITDKGVGMTREQLLNNLGVVAKSGTTEFLEASKKGNEDTLSLIGQFGVGFYSVYLVADKVTVVSKHNDDDQHIWESTANSVYTIAKDPRGNTLGRGTSIILHMKEDAEEFLNLSKLEEIVGRYSQFVNFPILLHKSREQTKQVPKAPKAPKPTLEEEPKELDGPEIELKQEEGDDLEVTDEEEAEEEEELETVTETVWDWERVNKAKAIWTRSPSDVTDQEYEDFFKALTKNKFSGGSLEKIHFKVEGEITFRSLLYIPKDPDQSLFGSLFDIKKSGVQLYVRRVLISEGFEDFLPRYMNFVRGVVDSDDLPLNVSRETLAQSRVLKVMGKKLVRKVLDTLRRMADEEEGEAEVQSAAKEGEEEKKEGEEEKKEEKESKESKEKYSEFWKSHAKSIKFGLIDDRKNKAKLAQLLRFPTSASDGKEVSLASYVKRMKKDQKYIYFMTGETIDKIKKSPFLEKVLSMGYEVIYMADSVDEYVVNALSEFDGIELQSITRENLKLGGEDQKKQLESLKEEYKPLTDWFKSTYGKAVSKVTVSNRLGQSPCVLVTGAYGWSANMERIIRGTTLTSANKNSYMQATKTLEINVHHPIMQAINSKIGEDADDESLKDMALILLDAARVSSGFQIADYKPFSERMARVVGAGLGVDPEAKVEEEVMDAEEENDEEEEEDEEEVEEEVEEAKDAEEETPAPKEEL